MDELISKLEALTEPCRECDGELLCAGLGWEKRWNDLWNTFTFHKGETWQGLGTVPKFTASIDAAMTLADPGAGLYLNRYWLLDGEAWSCSLVTGGIPNNPSQTFEMMDAPTPAIALCIAALKARAA